MAPTWVLGPHWTQQGLRQLGWVLLPLRTFLGVTFCYAGLSKLASRDFFTASSPASVQHQMTQLAPTSPIGALVELSLHAGAAVGVVIALGELAVGVGTLLGLRARLAAAGGALLALTFFLTVSWTTAPYYYGADIVFLFAWTPFLAVGAAGVLSADAWLATVAHARSCPAEPGVLTRRVVLGTGAATLAIAALTAATGWMLGGTPHRGSGAAAGTRRRPAGTRSRKHPATGKPTPHPAPSGTRIASVGALPPGQAARFTDPKSRQPAWVVCLAAHRYAAHSAVCTHAGCTVDYDATNREFLCPCHGGTYSARTGAVLGGPPPSPLPTIGVHVSGGQIYAD